MLILGLSVLWITACWVIDQEVFYLEEEALFSHESLADLRIHYAAWISLYIISCVLVFVALKSVSSNYIYDFIVWILIATLLALFYLTNRGYSWCHLGLFFGVPAIGLNYICIGFRKHHFYRLKTINWGVFIVVFIVGGIGEYQATDWYNFENEHHEIDICCYSIPSFLDWPVECNVHITDKLTHRSCQTEIAFGNGPYFSIYQDLNSDSLIYLFRDQSINHPSTVLDLKNETIVNRRYSQQLDSSMIQLILAYGTYYNH